MVSKKEKSLNQLLNSEKWVYDEFVKSRGKPRLDFGAIYLTRPNEKGISNLVVIIDLFEDDDRFYNKYVNVLPISTDTDFANDEDLIIEGIEKNGPLPCDILIHAGMQMTISIEDIVDYYAHLSKVHEKMLKEFLLLIQGDYSIDIEKFSIGSPIISQIDFRVEYRNFLIGEFEYLTLPTFSAISDMLREYEQDYKWDEEKIFKHNKRNFGNYLDFISNNFRNIDLDNSTFADNAGFTLTSSSVNVSGGVYQSGTPGTLADIDKNKKIYYETLIKGYNDFYYDKTKKKLKEKKKLIDATLEDMKKKIEGLTESTAYDKTLEGLTESTAELKMQIEKSSKNINKLINTTSSLYEKIKEYNKKGIRTIIPKDPKGPDLIIEHQDGSQDIIRDLNKESKIKLVHLSVDKIKGVSYHRGVNQKYYKVLRQSIKHVGILEPLDVTPDYELIDGNARLAIAKELNLKEVPAIIVYRDKICISDFYKHEYNKQIKNLCNYIAQGRMDKSFEIINKWENKPLPFSDIKNPYKPTIELIPYYATANIDGLNKVHNNLVDLVKKDLNHIDVDNGILITMGRILQIEGNYEKAIEQYQKLESKHIMNKYKIFTDPLVDCYLNVGDKTSAEYFANKNRSMIIKRAERANRAQDVKQFWAQEAIKAGEFASA